MDDQFENLIDTEEEPIRNTFEDMHLDEPISFLKMFMRLIH